MLIVWNTIDRFVVTAILMIAPLECFIIQVGKFMKDTSWKKVLFYKTYQLQISDKRSPFLASAV